MGRKLSFKCDKQSLSRHCAAPRDGGTTRILCLLLHLSGQYTNSVLFIWQRVITAAAVNESIPVAHQNENRHVSSELTQRRARIALERLDPSCPTENNQFGHGARSDKQYLV